jgi:glycerol-3-phosphate dehydrogenase (NAD(P)+)
MSSGPAGVAVLGAGAWGTALAIQAARAGRPVALWARDPERAGAMVASRCNALHLPGVALPPGLLVSADPAEVLAGAGLGLLAIPMQYLRATLAGLPAALPPLLVCAKGVEAGSLRLPLELLADVRPGQPAGILSGPNFAHEVAAGLPGAAVIASFDPGLREVAIAALATPGFRLYGSDDPVGVQVGGAAKNVIAIAAGVVTGAGLGENARAALVTRGLAELSRLVLALGGRAETAAGLSGLGDLLLTATGASSRNFSLGQALGQGRGLAEVLAGRSAVTEGVATAPALLARAAAAGVEMPIAAAVAALLAGEVTVAEAMARLLARPRRDE